MMWLFAVLIVAYFALSVRPEFEWGLYAALVLHAVILGLTVGTVDWIEPRLGLSFVGGLMAGIAVLIMKQNKLRQLVSPTLLVVGVLLTLALLAPSNMGSPVEVQAWVALHVALILFGYFGCVVAGVLGGVYIFVQHKLKEKSLQMVVRYPSLHILDRYLRFGVGLAVTGLFTGVTAGAFWGASRGLLNFDATIISSVLLLIWYGMALLGRVLGRSARWSAWLSLLGICGLTVYFFLSALLGTWHIGSTL